MRAGLVGIVACSVALAWGFVLGVGASAQGSGGGSPEAQAAVEVSVGLLAAELKAMCPLADPSDQQACDACRQALFRGSRLRASLGAILLWGRPNPVHGTSLKETNLTQFAPEAWTGLYAPLFMFDGTWRLDYDASEKLYRASLSALFRNALDPGQYPYPFWHSAKKWNEYQSANTLVLWIDPRSKSIVVGQFINDGQERAGLRSPPVARPPFDGQWMWTDAKGDTQPAPALFRGLFSDDNPYLGELEPRYRDLANVLRTGHCNDCHVPANPDGLKRLVLLQTPVHAASEIKRLMKAVRDNEMPVDDTHLYRDIDPDTRAALLDYGGAFEATVDAARAWEEEHVKPR
jgi:hypothetical protein